MERKLKELRGDFATTAFYVGILIGVLILTGYASAVGSTNDDMRRVVDVITFFGVAFVYIMGHVFIPRLMEREERRIIQKNHSLPLKAPLLLSSQSDPSFKTTTTTSN